MSRLLRWYGANPLHLLALLACFALAGYAAVQFVGSRPLAVAVWFLGAVIGHDLLLMPLYAIADRSVMAAIRHRAPGLPATPWINYLRVPAALSGLLLLVWSPLIFRLSAAYQGSTTLSPNPYVWHWLAVTGALFLLSAGAFALRLRGRPRPVFPPGRQAAARDAVGPDDESRHNRRHDCRDEPRPGHQPRPVAPEDGHEAGEPSRERARAAAAPGRDADGSSQPGQERTATQDPGLPRPDQDRPGPEQNGGHPGHQP